MNSAATRFEKAAWATLLRRSQHFRGPQLVNPLDLSFRGRAGRWFSGQAQHSLTRAESNTGSANWFPQDQYNPNNEWGRTNFDRRHSFNLLGNINADRWSTLGVRATLYSGIPYNETAGADDFHTGLGNARPPASGATLQAGGTADLDLILVHDFDAYQS